MSTENGTEPEAAPPNRRCTPESMAELAAALVRAKQDFRPLIEDSTARIVSKKGPSSSFDYTYPSLHAVNDAVDAALHANGLCTVTVLSGEAVKMMLLHVGGGSISSVAFLPKTDDLKELGGNVKSLTRFLKIGLTGIAAAPAAPKSRLKPKPAAKPKPRVDLDKAIRDGVKVVGLSEQEELDLMKRLGGDKHAVVAELRELYKLKAEQLKNQEDQSQSKEEAE